LGHADAAVILVEQIEPRIRQGRGQKVILYASSPTSRDLRSDGPSARAPAWKIRIRKGAGGLTTGKAYADAEGQRLKVTSELQVIEERAKTAAAYTAHMALSRLEELAALRDLGRNANARIYLDFPESVKETPDDGT
jgi:hypothetical protein